LELTTKQKHVFLCFLRTFFLPEYSNPEHKLFVFNLKNDGLLCVNHGSGFIKNTSKEVSVCLQLVDESEKLSKYVVKFDPKTEIFKDKIEAHLKTVVEDLSDKVAMCDMKSTTVQGVTLYKSTIINTDPTYTQI
jgi:hypothetical protein